MQSLKLCRDVLIRFLVVVVIISSCYIAPAFSEESEDSQIFISGFNAFQQKNYHATISKMNEVLQKYPDTPLRDMVLFWLSRAYFRNGNQQDAALYMSQFLREYPDNPLKATVDEELMALTVRHEKGEQLPAGVVSPVSRPVVVAGEDVEKARLVKEKAAREQLERDRAAALAEAEKNRRAAEAAEKARLAQEKAAREQLERDRAAAAEAEKNRRAAEVAENARIAALKAAEERAAAEARQAAIKKEEERKAAEKAEQLKAEQIRIEQERQAALKKEQERLAALTIEQERQAALKAEEERQDRDKALAAQRAQEAAELQKLSAFKADEERKAAEKLRLEKLQREQTDHAELVKQQGELMRQALEKAERKRLAAEKVEQERLAADEAVRAAKAEKKRLAALEAEKERAEAARVETARAEEERKAVAKAEQERFERERLEKERAAAVAAETARLAEARKEQERLAVEKAAAERRAAEQAAMARKAAVEAEQQRLVKQKQEQERVAAELAEKERLAAEVARREASRQAVVKVQSPVVTTVAPSAAPAVAEREQAAAAKSAMREKAIEQYKSILVAYPQSQAAAAAAAKLKELGVTVAVPLAPAQPVTEPVSETTQVLRFEVAQFAGLEFTLLPQAPAYNAAQRVSLPFVITNQGNGSDSYYLESGFPAEFAAGFSSSTTPAQAINQTPVLVPGESFKGFIHLTVPAGSIDGLRISHPVKASSRTAAEATQTREVRLVAAAPLLRATIKVDRSTPLPGERITYRVAVLNVGSTGAQDVSFRLNYPPQLEPVDFAASGFRQEMKAALVTDGIQLKSGESREFSLSFLLREGTLAGQEILTRAELTNNQLKTSAAFVSGAAYVQPQHGLLVAPGSDRLVVVPGQTVSIPFVVTNTGNVREKFSVAPVMKPGQAATVFLDVNRDGIRQANEPVITEVGPLAAKEEAGIVMEVVTPRSAADGTDDVARLAFRPSGDSLRFFEGTTRLAYSRPMLQMAMSGKDGRLKPGEVISYDLVISNKGSNIARIVELKSAWPEQLELVAADPSSGSVSNGILLWKFKELGAGEKRVIKVSLRVKAGTGVGTSIQVKNTLTYEDQIGNRY